ncbi:MAG: hypothetical protein ACK53V_12860, partial [Planctomycetota bacterium]
ALGEQQGNGLKRPRFPGSATPLQAFNSEYSDLARHLRFFSVNAKWQSARMSVGSLSGPEQAWTNLFDLGEVK